MSSRNRFAAVAVTLMMVVLASSVALTHSEDGTIFTVTQSKDGNLTYITYTGDYGFEDYCRTGSSTLPDLYSYLSDHVTCGRTINGVVPVNCSTFTVQQEDGSGYYAGRNFDFRYSNPGIVFCDPSGGYASVSTVDLRMFGNTDESFSDMASDTRYNAVAYIPLDGVNEKGVYVCINSVNHGTAVDQWEEGRVNMFTTSALRVILDHADSTEKAVELVSMYNLHSPSDYHIFVCDDSGDSVAIEYVDGEMCVTETRLLTNHYLTEKGRGTPVSQSSSHRFEALSQALDAADSMTEQQVRDVMRSVIQDNPDHVHYTRWSVVYDLEDLSAGICLRVGEELRWDTVYRYDLRGPVSG